jgi:hypothetical protein
VFEDFTPLHTSDVRKPETNVAAFDDLSGNLAFGARVKTFLLSEFERFTALGAAYFAVSVDRPSRSARKLHTFSALNALAVPHIVGIAPTHRTAGYRAVQGVFTEALVVLTKFAGSAFKGFSAGLARKLDAGNYAFRPPVFGFVSFVAGERAVFTTGVFRSHLEEPAAMAAGKFDRHVRLRRVLSATYLYSSALDASSPYLMGAL